MKNYRDTLYGSYRQTNEARFNELDRIRPQRIRDFRSRLRKWVPANRDAAILDVAAGAGELLTFLREENFSNARGIDVSESQVAHARSQGVTGIECANMLEYLPKHPGEFDTIIASHVIEHLTKDEVVESFTLIRQALKPGGRAIVLVPNSSSPIGLIFTFGDFTHEVFFSAMSLGQVALATGFDVVHLGGATPDPTGLRGASRTVLWRAVRPVFQLVFGHGSMKWGHIMEPEIIGVFERPLSG